MDQMTYRWLIVPNLLLAWIPYLLSEWLCRIYNKTNRLTIGLIAVGLAWLFFYPNSSYIWTDLAHIGYLSKHESRFMLHYDVLINIMTAATGWLLGVFSLHRLHMLVHRERGAWLANTFAVLVLFLSSIGVYLGRFLRWNTWDLVTKPISIVTDSAKALFEPEALFFITSFALVTGSLYFVLYYWKRSPH
jgi:uncharacterized membrane protein